MHARSPDGTLIVAIHEMVPCVTEIKDNSFGHDKKGNITFVYGDNNAMDWNGQEPDLSDNGEYRFEDENGRVWNESEITLFNPEEGTEEGEVDEPEIPIIRNTTPLIEHPYGKFDEDVDADEEGGLEPEMTLEQLFATGQVNRVDELEGYYQNWEDKDSEDDSEGSRSLGPDSFKRQERGR